MELMKKLKARSLKRVLLPVCLFLALAIACLIVSKCWLLVMTPADLYSVPREELEGKYVSVEVPYIYACYAYTEQYKNNVPTGTVTSSEYIIDANENDYCGLLLPKSLVAKGDALLEASDAYMNYETDEITGTFTVSGIIKAMPQDSLEYYHKVVSYDDRTASDQETFLPLYLEARDQEDTVTTIVFLAIGLVFFAIAAVMLLSAASGKNQKQLIKKASELSPQNPDYILSHVQELYENAPSVCGLRMNGRLLFLEQGAKQYLYATEELVWAYQNTIQHKRNGIPTYKTYNLVLRMADGSTQEISMKEPQVQEQLQKIFALVPTCVMGYSKELETAFQKDRASLRALAEAQRAPKQTPDVPLETPEDENKENAENE